MQQVLNDIGAVIGVMSAVGVFLHVFKLDQKPWAKVYLSLTANVIGAYKGYSANKAANDAK